MKTTITKVLLLIGIGLFCTISAIGQDAKPQKLYGIAKEDKPISFYKEQSRLWKNEIDKNSDNAEAWKYYYVAERSYLQLSQPDLWANHKPAFYKKLSPIINDSKKHIGGKFEYFYMKGINGTRDESTSSFEKAYAIDPDRSEVHGWLFSHYIPKFEDAKCKDLAKSMLKNNIYSDANLKWNYNALQSIEPNGVIISNGDMDGLPKWVLQYGDDVRPDVLITNKWLLADVPSYRKEIYSRMNITMSKEDLEDFENLTAYADFLTVDILKRSVRPTYISAGTQLSFFQKNGIDDKMYLVGNVLKYSEQSFDNTSSLIDNFENKYLLEYLFKTFQYHPQDEIIKSQMNLTYLPGLVHLKNHYSTSKQKEKVQYVNSLIEKIAEDSGRKKEVLSWFDH